MVVLDRELVPDISESFVGVYLTHISTVYRKPAAVGEPPCSAPLYGQHNYIKFTKFLSVEWLFSLWVIKYKTRPSSLNGWKKPFWKNYSLKIALIRVSFYFK